MQKPTQRKPAKIAHVDTCDWPKRQISSSSMLLEMDVRNIHDFKTDAWLEVSCHSGNSTKKIECAKSTVDSLHNNMMHRDFFDFAEYYRVSNTFMTWMWSLTGVANGLIIGADGDATGNMCAVAIGDLMELSNYYTLYKKLGLKYGYVKDKRHLLEAESKHDRKGGYRSNIKTQKYYYKLHKMNKLYGLFMFVPQFFIDLDACLGNDIMNVGKSETYTIWTVPKIVDVFMNLSSITYTSDFYTNWTFYFYSSKVVLGTLYMLLYIFDDPMTAIINGVRVFSDSYRLAFEFFSY